VLIYGQRAVATEGEQAMKGDARVMQYLNVVLRNELTAINQYFLHARMLKSWGVTKLGAHEYKESIDEMKHADRLIERILFLDGTPHSEKLGKLFVGETVPQILECDLRLEQEAMSPLREAITHCTSVQDFVTRELLIAILEGEEEHVDFLETQLRLIEKMGLQNYIQLHSEPPG
jgi:bacterioferritin